MLLHLQSLAKRKQPLNLRVDLRVRNKAGFTIYDKGDGGPLYGTLKAVSIRRPKDSRRKYLCWTYQPDPGVEVPSATPGFARVVLGPTSGNYFVKVVDTGASESPSAPPPSPPSPASP
jgi:hypothetical protein